MMVVFSWSHGELPAAPPEAPVPTQEQQVDQLGLPESSEERNLGIATNPPTTLTGS